MCRSSSLSEEVNSILDQQFKKQTQRESSFIILLSEGQSFPFLCLLVLLLARGSRCNITFLFLTCSCSPFSSDLVQGTLVRAWLQCCGWACKEPYKVPCSGCGSCLLAPFAALSFTESPVQGLDWALGPSVCGVWESLQGLWAQTVWAWSAQVSGPIVGEFYIWLSAHRWDRLQCSCN